MKRLLSILAFALLAVNAAFAEVWQARYGVAETFNFKLYNADGTLDVDEVDGGTEVSLSCNEGAETTATNDFVDEGTFYSIALTATEMQCERIAVVIAATTTEVFFIQTTDNASAMTPSFGQSGDAYARLGAPAGASVSADILAVDNFVDDLESRIGTPSNLGGGATVAANLSDIEGQTDDIGVAGAGLTAIDLPNQTMDITGSLSGAVGSVTGNVGGNVTGSVGSVASGGISEASFATTAGSFKPLGIIDQGTAQAATATTVQLRSAAAFGDDTILGATIVACGSTQGYCQAGVITDYVGSTDTATVATWGVTPSGTITYYVFGTAPASGSGGSLTAADVWAYATRTLTALDEDSTTIDLNASAVGSVAGSVASVATGGITAASFGAGAIDAAAIAADAIGASELATDAIGATEIAANAITDAEVAADVTIASVTGAVGSVTGAVGSVTGNVGGNVTGSVGSVATGGITAASIAADAIGASELAADAGTELATAAWASATRTLSAGTNIVLAKGTGITGFNDPTVAAIADAVWDEAQSGHTTAGTFGLYLDSAISGVSTGGVSAGAIADAVWDEAISGHLTGGTTGAVLNGAGDPWATALPGAYSAGSAGYIIGTNLNATVSSRASQTSVDTVDDYVDTEVAAILDDTGTSGVVVSATSVRTAVGLAAANLDTQIGDLPTNAELATSQASADDATLAAIAALNNLSAANVRDVVIEDQGSGVTLGCAISVVLAYAAGDLATTGSTSTYEDPSGTETRITGTVASAGNRTASVTCPTY